ncbi:hypothetical protein SNOG_15572 [Parastagonospora nodorum SN15]|uniref:Uncharacterized protein n=1 Tax=Phaeosphaeria nodorum (strain SN15 / ATCC MYA-4574 / FGSC 10173) TaxID=321614 RepID=Q0TXT8_PHANO|nr:hypothetical protein SNOG_15572 [Parastagonospora nodorum SN15]EAT76947.1 hypothetical protein SNOG_15572 [Parastagonospora nodorum SN15]
MEHISPSLRMLYSLSYGPPLNDCFQTQLPALEWEHRFFGTVY